MEEQHGCDLGVEEVVLLLALRVVWSHIALELLAKSDLEHSPSIGARDLVDTQHLGIG
jgi:hypothetical protein